MFLLLCCCKSLVSGIHEITSNLTQFAHRKAYSELLKIHVFASFVPVFYAT